MAVPRTRLGGLLGGGTIVPENRIDLGGALDAIGRGATSLIQNAYLRKRQQAQDALAANTRAQQAEQQRVTNERADRDFQLRVKTVEEQAKEREARRLQAAAALAKKDADHLRDLAEKEAARKQGLADFETKERFRLRMRPSTGANAVTPLDRRISEADRAIPRLRPPMAQEFVRDPSGQLVPNEAPEHPAAAKAFVADSTAKAGTALRLRTQRGDVPPPPPPPTPPPAAVDPEEVAMRADHRDIIARIRASGKPPAEVEALIIQANRALQSDLATLAQRTGRREEP